MRGWKWHHEDHINVLELEALYQSLRWRVRGGRSFNKRLLHLVDSQVVLGVTAKGRSSSKKLNRVVKKLNVLLLGSHIYLLLGWVRSELNPADPPSRWFRAAIVSFPTTQQRTVSPPKAWNIILKL